MWAIMKAMPWSSFESDMVRFETPKVGEGQPQRFIPVFDNLDDARKFAGEDIHLLVELRTGA